MDNQIEILKRALSREKLARKQAEQILEEKSNQLYESNQKLQNLNDSLEFEIQKRLKEISQREEELRHLFENNPFPMLIYDYESLKIVDLNQPAVSFYGNKNKLIGKEVYKLHIETEQKEALATIRLVLKDKPIEFKEWNHKVNKDEIKPIELNSSEISYKGKKSRLLLINDITVRKKFESEKELNQKKYQDLIEGASDIIYRCNTDGDFIYVNPTCIYVTGYSLNELLQMSYLELVDKSHLNDVKKFYENQLEQNERSTYLEFPVISKNGDRIWVGQNVDIQVNDKGSWEVNALARDITELKQARDTIERSEKKYKNILENLKLGILEVDLDGKITNAYPKFTELSGYSKEELIGKVPTDFLLSPNHRSTMARQSVLRAQGMGSVYEVEFLRKNGEKRWVIISGAPYYNTAGEMVGTVGIHLDITRRKKIEGELRQAKEIAENSVKTKELFMANMSHEIRTPMNAIIGMSDLMLNSQLGRKQKDYVNAINTSADNLLVIINDILDFSKIESGKLTIEPINENINKIINNALKTISLKAEEKGIEVITRITELNNYLFDPIRLGQVLINLLGNAVKFTPSGEIMIRCRKQNVDDYYDSIQFSIRDTGIGIAKDKLEFIFYSFNQEEERTSQEYGGTGLGLPISKKLIELMGGVLEVKSTKGVGSTFSFSITLKKAQNILINENINIPEFKDIEGLTILLVEDHEINRIMAQIMLDGWNCITDIATNGIEAIEKVKNNKYDIILMDVRMPIMNGLEATTIIRKVLNINTPIIALTANAIKGDNETCFKAGMNDYVSKPYKKDELLAVIHKYKPKHFQKDKQNTTSDNEVNLVDISRLEISSGNDKDFIRKMIALFIEDTPKQIEIIKEALQSNNWEQISKTAHKIKPSIDYVSVAKLQDQVRVLESGIADKLIMKKETQNFLLQLELLTSQLKEI
ncbi:MAG: PAS domain S-box-containing protein [Flavobacteriales bacterium]|jgi:PAS domain S-box-containing protein